MALSQKINIPQKPPMVMIDEITATAEGKIETRFFIRPDNPLCHEGYLTEAGLIENIAQTAAARTGIRNSDVEKEPPTGFIGGIRHLQILRYPMAGEQITTTVEVEHEVFNASVVRGSICLGSERIASCQLKIFLIPDNG